MQLRFRVDYLINFLGDRLYGALNGLVESLA